MINRHLGIGWEFVDVCIDDASRIAFSRVMKDERKESAIAFLEAAVAYYASLGVKVERVMTDNGSCYLSRAFGKACKGLGLRHIRTKPYTPKTNGKAERFIQTSLREWAYVFSAVHHHAEQICERCVRRDVIGVAGPSPSSQATTWSATMVRISASAVLSCAYTSDEAGIVATRKAALKYLNMGVFAVEIDYITLHRRQQNFHTDATMSLTGAAGRSGGIGVVRKTSI